MANDDKAIRNLISVLRDGEKGFADIGEHPHLIVCDVSFISVTLLIPALAPLLGEGGDWVILVKPQFEVGRELVGKGGIVRDSLAHQLACKRVADALHALHFRTLVMDSPIQGAEGNREFLLRAWQSQPTMAE